MNYKLVLAFLFSIFIFFAPQTSFSEINGSVNLSGDIQILTGIFGYTINSTCNATSTCRDYICFIDYDSLSNNADQGWCLPSSTYCYHASSSTDTPNIITPSGSKYCRNLTHYYTCSNGVWGSITTCSSSECSNSGSIGTCNATQSNQTGDGDGTGSGGSTTPTDNTTTTPTKTASITVTATIQDFTIEQNKSTDKFIEVKNNGEVSLSDVILSLTGLNTTWFSISPSEYDNVAVNDVKRFTITFSIPAEALMDEYKVDGKISSNESAATTSLDFKVKVFPSNETVQKEILPAYDKYLQLIVELENNLTKLENSGKNVTELKAILTDIKQALNDTKNFIDAQNYFSASQKLSYIDYKVAEFVSKSFEISPPEEFQWVYIFVIIVIAIAAGIVLYLFWPTEDTISKKTKKQWAPKKSNLKNIEDLIDTLRFRFKRGKKNASG